MRQIHVIVLSDWRKVPPTSRASGLTLAGAPVLDFWGEVSSRHAQDRPAPANPANSQWRVLSEIFAILAAASMLAAAVTILLPGVA